MGQAFSQTFPPAPKFHVKDIPDQTGKIAIVTGGNSGIGKEIVRALLSHNSKVYMAARNANKAKLAIEELKKDTGKEALFLELDLSSLKGVKRAADEFLNKEKELHSLYNNGGIMYLAEAPGSLDVTEEGLDVQWGTNVVGPFYFTKLLMPALLAGVETSPDKKARVIFSSSIVLSKDIFWDTLTDTPERKKSSGTQRYGQSKLANIIMAREFARERGNTGIVFTSLDNGGTQTELQRHMNGFVRTILNLLLKPPVMGALTPLWAGTSPETVDFNGKFLIPWARVGNPVAASKNPELIKKLWAYLEAQVKKHESKNIEPGVQA